MWLPQSVEQFDGIREQIIVEVLVQVQHEMQTDLSWVHNLLSRHSDLLHVSILIETFDDRPAVESWHEEVDITSGFPGLLGHYFFSLIVDVENRSGEGFSCLMPEGMEDRHWSHVEILDHLLIPRESVFGILEPKLGLPHGLLLHVDDVVVIDDTIGVFAVVELLVTVGHQHKLSRSGLPGTGQAEREVVDLVFLASGVLDPDGGVLSVVRIAPEVEIVQLHLCLMLIPEPQNHGVVVSPLYRELIGPQVLLRLELSHRLALLGLISVLISIVGESQSWIIEGPLLNDHEHLGVIEGFNVHLCDIIEQILMIDGSGGFSLEIDDVYFLAGDIHNDDLSFIEHGEEVNDVRVLLFEEDFAIGIHMHDALISTGVDDLAEDEGIVVGSGETEDFGHLILQDQLVVLFEKHISYLMIDQSTRKKARTYSYITTLRYNTFMLVCQGTPEKRQMDKEIREIHDSSVD